MKATIKGINSLGIELEVGQHGIYLAGNRDKYLVRLRDYATLGEALDAAKELVKEYDLRNEVSKAVSE